MVAMAMTTTTLLLLLRFSSVQVVHTLATRISKLSYLLVSVLRI
jgi:hypothetical protein